MRLVTYQSENGSRIAGVNAQGQLVDLNQADSTLPTCMKTLLAGGEKLLSQTADAINKGTGIDSSQVKLLAPIPNPQKVMCIGLNYADHAKESGVEPPEEPVLFNKFPTAVAAHEEDVILPSVSTQVDYEAELVVVIGKTCKQVSETDASSYVAGYCTGHDVSARDWQLNKPGKQWLSGKTFDGFAPYGPYLVTSDEVGDPGNLKVQLRLNGETMQDSTTQQLIFGIPELVSYLSQICTLLPGDIIFTGTPPGVGMARKPPVFLKPGDVCEVEIEKLGTLRNRFVAEERI
ncbi:Ureidoglycolate lyase [Polystyrenella longa]|uniref:Ureidoglycolate lyase n=1 Tax=Polystyrenella longa TaxID=2528007 RepID=A0A518CHJ2_9PLAN|nr:fumarylacetoacetate hydrolase family protein [Polystyrenella longa]QDU78695.1 Ureidoglycolate lyase [Polystyrenella longa]